ncbi:DUF72 domain-containing protein [Caryophanon latum]|uniref:DUF72 domain-containing protein n=1 Tax=Caryophanon latum TaxID=33977 RepID=A0A1C0YZD5_9BACL|nr:DUF72 domain-containing protein [Caryophanon latum]OCS92554.1 hypothetical protein A6K76_06640 [Caryophanon latum]
MIYIGATGWSDHPLLYSEATAARDKLFDYSGHFPCVELDTSFYAIPRPETIDKWCSETPDAFQFIVKAYQGITGHQRGDDVPFETRNDMFNAYRTALDAFEKHGKLACVLAQFPPWFDCKKENITYLRYLRQQLVDYSVAIEFRNETWYQEQYRERTLAFLREQRFIHVVCDEPQAGSGSVPLVPVATHEKAFLRIHGRNLHGWRNIGSAADWRKVRTLYDYNDAELMQLVEHTKTLEHDAQHVFVIFNNNSGGHAAKNAKQFQQMMNITYTHLSPKQIDLFEGEF